MNRWLAVTGLYVACAAVGGLVFAGDAMTGAVFGMVLAPLAAFGTLEMAAKGGLRRAILTTLAIVIVPAVLGGLLNGELGFCAGGMLGGLLAAGLGVAPSKTPPPRSMM